MKYFAVLLLLAGVIAIGSAVTCGDAACQRIYMPQCAQAADGTWSWYANECEFNNCGGAAAYSVSCYQHVDSVAECSC